MLYYIGRSFFRALLTTRYGWQVTGTENVPPSGPVILAANHISYLDPPLLGSALQRPVYFMAKAELFEIPVFGPILRRVHAFPVVRGTADRRAIRRSLELLEQGEVVALFPEGTRNREADLLPPQGGIALIALRSNAVVIPTGISGTSKPDRNFYRPTQRPWVRIHFGPPVQLDDLRGERAGKAAIEQASRRVMDSIARQLQITRAGRIPRSDLE